MENILTDGFWAFLGVLAGGAISIISQMLFAKSSAKAEAKKILAGKMSEVLTYTKNVENAVTTLINFSKRKLDEIESYDEILKEFQRFIPECVAQWPDYFCILNWHFQEVVKQKRFAAFIDVMGELSFFEKGLNSFVIPAYDIEILKNRQEEIKGYVSKLEITKEINGLVRTKYFKKFR